MDKREKSEKIIEELTKLFPNPKIALKYSTPWELFVAVVLSAQSTDKKVNEVTKNLFKKYKSVQNFANVPLEKLQHDIHSIGLFRNKARNIQNAAKIIIQNGGSLPNSMDELLKLPGVGRKTANILLGNLFNKIEGIAVDTHVARLSKLFGLTDSSDPKKIEKDLMNIIPRKEWFNFTYRMIDYGRKYCTAYCKHNNCPLKVFVVDKNI